MGTRARPYNPATDYEAVSRFLIEAYEPAGRPLNWLQPRWEYMHAHPMIADVPLGLIAVYEDRGTVVGVVHPEHDLSAAYFQRKRGRDELLSAMFDHAEQSFGGTSPSVGRDIVGVYVNEFDAVLQQVAFERGYERLEGQREGYSKLQLDAPVPAIAPPSGFRLQSLSEENDHRKINRCLWRGFNHEGEIPALEADRPGLAQRAPNFRKDLTIVAVDGRGDYVAYAGTWYVPANGIAYVEPVATDPDFRRNGLGRAVVLESVRRAHRLGAKVAWVGSELEFYRAIGFTPGFRRYLWVKWRD